MPARKSLERVNIWVHPEFQKKLKIEAAKRSKSVIGLTRDLAEYDNPLRAWEREHEKKKRRPIDFI